MKSKEISPKKEVLLKNKEILLIVDSISNEKGMDKESIFHAIEVALETIIAKQQEEEVNIRVSINRKTGNYKAFRRFTVVADEDLFSESLEIALSKAKEIDKDLAVGDIVEEPMESVEIMFGRIDAQLARQVILREIRRAALNEMVIRYKKLIGKLVSGIVKKVSRESVILDVGDGIEATLYRDKMLPKDAARQGDRMRGILYEVREDKKGFDLLLSRISPEMLIELFKTEVPEISEGIVEIKGVARDAGLRAKMAVKTSDGRIDPIGACVGIRGSRVQGVSNELGGEKIDIILWDADPAQLVVNAMSPAEIASIVVEEEKKGMDIVVKQEQLPQAIGKNGQNVRLASELSGWTLNVVTVAEEEQKIQKERGNLVEVFTKSLDVEEDLANILVQEGFTSLEDVAYAPLEDLSSIEDFDEEIANALRNRARDVLLEQALASNNSVGNVEPAKDLLEMEGMTRHFAYVLANHGIITREDLAEQAVDDLLEIVKDLSEDDAAKLIMTARKPWFEKED